MVLKTDIDFLLFHLFIIFATKLTLITIQTYMPDTSQTPIEISTDFYYSKARDAWNEWKNLSIDATTLSELPTSIKDYKRFRDEESPKIAAIRDTLFRVVAYCDGKAKDKHKYNAYDDKRVLTSSGTRQNAWVVQLVGYKRGLSPSGAIANLTNYLESPADNFPIASEKHKRLIYEHYIGEPYDPNAFADKIKARFAAKVSCANAENVTAAITVRLYSMKKEWSSPEYKLKEERIMKTIGLYTQLLKKNKNLILQGAPGTGKTYTAAELAVACIDGMPEPDTEHKEIMERYAELKEDGRIAFTTFHQSMDYEDFVEGLRPEVKNGVVTYHVKSGIFKTICDEARKSPSESFVLIIDEINRGNVSKIFGELITLIEKDKRLGQENALTAQLTYSNVDFGVPDNLYILGTMNTTDRSTGTLDYALRRRFVFVTLKADKEVVKKQNSAIATKAATLFERVNKFIDERASGDIDFADLMVGHSYFIAKDEEELRDKVKYEIVPLIKEYIRDGILTQPKRSKDDDDIFAQWEKPVFGAEE